MRGSKIKGKVWIWKRGNNISEKKKKQKKILGLSFLLDSFYHVSENALFGYLSRFLVNNALFYYKIVIRPRRDLNSGLKLRKLSFYPNYTTGAAIVDELLLPTQGSSLT
jgi:hypothetical protein